MNNFEEFESFFKEAEESWAFHGVDISRVIEELFGDTINEEDSIFGIGQSDIIKKCREMHEIILRSPKSFKEGIEIMKKIAPESTKIVLWLHMH